MYSTCDFNFTQFIHLYIKVCSSLLLHQLILMMVVDRIDCAIDIDIIIIFSFDTTFRDVVRLLLLVFVLVVVVVVSSCLYVKCSLSTFFFYICLFFSLFCEWVPVLTFSRAYDTHTHTYTKIICNTRCVKHLFFSFRFFEVGILKDTV